MSWWWSWGDVVDDNEDALPKKWGNKVVFVGIEDNLVINSNVIGEDKDKDSIDRKIQEN